ncbi:unnamed protein product, partial [Iphiclides podalirius]
MFKLVVLSALLAAAAAEPGFFSAPLAPVAYAATLAAPATTTYVQQTRSYIPAPTVYSELSFPHFIKKRSASLYNGYVAPTAYVASAPVVAPYASTYIARAPIAAYSSAVLPTYAAPTHFIKKRSASIPYIAPAPLASTYVASAPLTTTYSTAILPSASYYPSYYTGYPSVLPLIKK